MTAVRWDVVPFPWKATNTFPGLAFAYEINSCADLAGNPDLTTRTFGTVASIAIGIKSAGRKGSFLYRLSLMAIGPGELTSNV
jgi:hypothetical protein